MNNRYYDEFLRYWEMAKWQHENCNLGTIPHIHTPYDDDLIKHVYLYDVVARKYAGFGQLLLDVVCDISEHPYRHKMPQWRKELCESFVHRKSWRFTEYGFIFFVHRLTGSGINYAQSPSGYCNSVLMKFGDCRDFRDMIECIKASKNEPIYTSVGYQIARFPKNPKPDEYRRAGDHFMCEELMQLVLEFSNWLVSLGPDPTFRRCMKWLHDYHLTKAWPMFWFQYAATLADYADFFPEMIEGESHFFYGSNAKECGSYLTGGKKSEKALDCLMDQICFDTKMKPYDAEDVMCDFIRWVESYINPSQFYADLDMDSIFSSSKIVDHPYGRQRKMLELGLVKTFNGSPHPANDKVIKDSGITPEDYRQMVKHEF